MVVRDRRERGGWGNGERAGGFRLEIKIEGSRTALGFDGNGCSLGVGVEFARGILEDQVGSITVEILSNDADVAFFSLFKSLLGFKGELEGIGAVEDFSVEDLAFAIHS